MSVDFMSENDANPKIAILLAAYNGKDYLSEQIDSILCQHGVEITIYISIDLSDDGSEMLCKSFAAKDSRVILLPTGTRFGSATKNFFHLMCQVDFSNFEYVGFSDQDDIWLDCKLEKAVQRLKTGEFSGYSSNVEAFWPDGKRVVINKAQPQRSLDYLFEAGGPGCTYVFNQSLAQAIQKNLILYSDKSQQIGFHDWFCYAFARGRGYSWFIDPGCYMLYRQHAGNAIGINNGMKAFFRRFKYVFSEHCLKQTEIIMDIVFDGAPTKMPIQFPITRLGFIKLAFLSRQCRRKNIDQVYFFCFCLLMAIMSSK